MSEELLVPGAAGSGLPALQAKQMLEALAIYKELQASLDRAMGDQVMELDGKKFRKKGYWRAIALAFRVTVRVVSERREVSGRFLDQRENFGWLVTAEATDLSGRTAIGDGSCFAVEKARRFRCPHPDPARPGGKWTLHFPHTSCPDFDPDFQWRTLPADATEHNVRSHANTRAFNRAVSNLVGFGEVSAEEVERTEHGRPDSAEGPGAVAATEMKPSAPAADGATTVKGVTEKSGKSAKGPWTYYDVTFADGRKGRTFDQELGAEAKDAQSSGARVRPVIEQTEKGANLKALMATKESNAPPTEPDEPVAGPEKILSIRTVKTAAGPRWIVQTEKRQVVTDEELLATMADEAKKAGVGLVPAFKVVSGRGGSVNKLSGWEEPAATDGDAAGGGE